MTVTTLAPVLAGRGTPPADADAVRLQAARLLAAGHRQQRAVEAVAREQERLARQWRGDGAAAALAALASLRQALLTSADMHEQASEVLRACAARLDEAAALWQQAESLGRQDAIARVARAQAAARGAFVSPYDVDGSPLRAQARLLAEQAHTVADEATARAAAQLDDLRPVAQPGGLSALEQLRGVGTGAVNAVSGSVAMAAALFPTRLLTDRQGWLSDVRALRDGGTYAAEHPAEAGAAMVGLDLLREGRYGEWAGGLLPDLVGGVLSGGALPMTRRTTAVAEELADLAEDVDDLQRVRGRPVPSVDAGGPVQPRAGAAMSGRYPREVLDLEPERRRHILDGDPPEVNGGKGGGHRAGTGKGKSEFPAHWSDDDIIRRVMETAKHPQRTADQDGRLTLVAEAEHEGVLIRVIVATNGRIVTAHPMSGPGVVKNSR